MLGKGEMGRGKAEVWWLRWLVRSLSGGDKQLGFAGNKSMALAAMVEEAAEVDGDGAGFISGWRRRRRRRRRMCWLTADMEEVELPAGVKENSTDHGFQMGEARLG